MCIDKHNEPNGKILSFSFSFLILGSVNCLDFFPSSHSNVIMNSGVKTLKSMWCYKILLFCLQLQLDDLVQNGDKTAFKCQFSFMYNKNLFPFCNWNEHEKGSEHKTVDARHWGVKHSHTHTHIAFITDGRFFASVLRHSHTVQRCKWTQLLFVIASHFGFYFDGIFGTTILLPAIRSKFV